MAFVQPSGPRRSGGQVAAVVVGGIVGLIGLALLFYAIAIVKMRLPAPV